MQSGLAKGGLVDHRSEQRKSHKHQLDEEVVGVTDGGDVYAQNGLQNLPRALAAEKRRKLGHFENGLDFEPKFNALSLKPASAKQEDDTGSTTSSKSSTRSFSAFSASQVIPSPALAVVDSRVASRKADSKSIPHSATMHIDPRYDPERPHVVFVDTLSDSENDDAVDSSAVTTDNELSASDLEDGYIVPPAAYGHASRPLRLNQRLRQHLRRQQALKHGPILRETLNIPDSRNHVAERGLILYRPLSWPVVQEPDDVISPTSGGLASITTPSIHDVQIEELPPLTAGIEDEDDADAAMEID